MSVPGAVQDPSLIETSEVEVEAPAGRLKAYLARPTGARRGAVIVIHEAFGMVEHIRDVTRRFAAAGYDTLAPDLYTRIGPPDPDRMESVLPKMLAVDDATVVADLEASAAYLRALPGGASKVGVIGFCSGGRQALLLAVSSDKVDAAIDCWGGSVHRASADEERMPTRPVPPMEMMDKLHCPTLIVGGAEDQNPSPEIVEELVRRGKAAGKDVTSKVFPDAGHAFFADYRPSYREAQAHELWDDVLAFFGRHLA